MDFLVKLFNKIFGTTSTPAAGATVPANKSGAIIKAKPQKVKGEIPMLRDISDEEIKAKQNRSKYIKEIKNPDYKVKSGDNIESIAKKFNVTIYALMDANGLSKTSVVSIGQNLKIPPTRDLKNIKNLNDIAGALGVSKDFILHFKRLEDGAGMKDNQFHNVPYKDKNGVLTIGIGHAVKQGDKQKLTDNEVCALCAKDLLNAEDALKNKFGHSVYEKFPPSIKEALLDMVFNKGIDIVDKCEGLQYCLKEGNRDAAKYEAAINKMTYNKSVEKNKAMSGLTKRRLYDISRAVKIYKDGKIPQTNLNTIQNLYNEGVGLLKMECEASKTDFKSVLVGFNKEIQEYFGNAVKLKLINPAE